MSSETIVVNSRVEGYEIFIGRPGRWGNPFIIGRDGDRALVIEKYREWILTQPDLLADLPRLQGKVLGCYCKPLPCHGDVLVELIKERCRMSLTPEQIAAVCHEANRMYCTVTGDRSQPEWYDAPEWQKISAVQGVQTLIADPSLTPEQMHQNWMAFKLRDGWTYGLIKDAEKKQHPCMVEYSALPEVQKMKDHLFHAIVKTLANLPKGYVTT